MDWAGELPMLLRVALAMGLGAVIGADREVAHKPAGLRTHMLLAGAASLFTEVGLAMLRQYGQANLLSTRVDPVIIIQAVAAAVGVAVSSRLKVLAVGVTLLALVTLRGVRVVEEIIRRRGRGRSGTSASSP